MRFRIILAVGISFVKSRSRLLTFDAYGKLPALKWKFFCTTARLTSNEKVTKRENATIPQAAAKENLIKEKTYIYKKTMPDRCHFLHQKAGR